MTVDVTTTPLFLNARTGVYTAWALRQPFGDVLGEGVAGVNDFVVAQRGAGANNSVDIASAAQTHIAWIGGDDVSDQGAYRVAYSGAALNITIPANASGNPRVDKIVLRVGDSQHAGALDKAYIDVVQGTPTVGATLANESGVAATPVNAIVLATVLAANSFTQILTANIQDKRPWFKSQRQGYIGEVRMFGMATVPAGWLTLDGQAISRTRYWELFALYGTAYGTGDGSTTFNLPDVRGRTVLHLGQGPGLTNRVGASTGGEESHVLSTGEMPAHTHSLALGGTKVVTDGAGTQGAAAGSTQGLTTAPTATGSVGSGTAHNNMQPWIAFALAVKAL